MRLLLDTHVFLWAVADSPSLTSEARRTIANADEVYVSAASIWEVAIKAGLGKIQVDIGQLAGAIGASGFVELPVTVAHAASVSGLPHHHRDPFDRMLVAQAMTEPLVLLTADAMLSQYGGLVRLV
jgi:PIN domain nuclease of toxin-antitoxin system